MPNLPPGRACICSIFLLGTFSAPFLDAQVPPGAYVISSSINELAFPGEGGLFLYDLAAPIGCQRIQGLGQELQTGSGRGGKTNLTDPILLLTFIFGDGPPPRELSRQCGTDSTPDELTCAAFAACE